MTASPREGEAAYARGHAGSLAASGPGARYLAERLDIAAQARSRHSRAQAIAQTIISILGPLSSHENAPRVALCGERLAVSIAFLVPRDRIGCFTKRLDMLAVACPDLAIICTGPWPPYSFTDWPDHSLKPGEDKHAAI